LDQAITGLLRLCRKPASRWRREWQGDIRAVGHGRENYILEMPFLHKHPFIVGTPLPLLADLALLIQESSDAHADSLNDAINPANW
jgi:hypothetical protein